MNTRNMILSGLLAVTVLMIMSTNLVYAGENGASAGTAGELKVFLMKKAFAICGQDGSMPPADGQQYGCLPGGPFDKEGLRVNEYAFTGERIAELVVARHPLNAQQITGAEMVVGDAYRPQCNDVTADYTGSSAKTTWTPFGVSIDISQELTDMPPSYVTGGTTGFDVSTDKIYECTYEVTDSMLYDELGTPVYVEVSARDQDAKQSQWQLWYFNPEILIDVGLVQGGQGASLEFENGVQGQTVYATDTLYIKNCAEGGVDLMVWLAGKNMPATVDGAQCPGNVLEIKNMEFRCKIGTIFNNEWNDVPYYDSNKVCPDTNGHCKNGMPLLGDATGNTPAAPFEDGLLANGHTAECWFRLNYPTGCVGSFGSSDAILIIARAI